jgi:hypothetical protein
MRHRTTILVAILVVAGAGLTTWAQFGGGGPGGGFGGGPGMPSGGASVRIQGGPNFVQVGEVTINLEHVAFVAPEEDGVEVYFTGAPSLHLVGSDAETLRSVMGNRRRPAPSNPQLLPYPTGVENQAIEYPAYKKEEQHSAPPDPRQTPQPKSEL